MKNDLGKNSGDRYPVRMGINRVDTIFKKYEKEIPVYEGDIRVADLEHARVAYTLKGDVYRRGDFFIALKDDSMLPLWGKDDLVLLKKEQEKLVVGDHYYFVLKDGTEIIGRLTSAGVLKDGSDITGGLTSAGNDFIVTPENTQYEQVNLKREVVLKIYKITEGLKKEDALREREGNK